MSEQKNIYDLTKNNNEMNSGDYDNDDNEIEIPDENNDKEYDYDTIENPEKANPYPHNHLPKTVPALFTYFDNTKLPKVLAVSNECGKLIQFADSLKDKIHKEHEQVLKLIERYNKDEDYNSVELFKLFVNKYDVKAGIPVESVREIIDKFKEDGNRIAVECIKSKKGATCAIYYSKDIKTIEEVCDENKEIIPDFFIDNILVL